jgi:hypothetical protein
VAARLLVDRAAGVPQAHRLELGLLVARVAAAGLAGAAAELAV